MKSIRDIYKIGKGPSSSHTAGAARLAQVAGKIAGPHITDVVFTLYGSFSHTSRGSVNRLRI